MINLSALREHLSNNAATVVFTKANGSIREMQCTLADSVVPKTTQKSNHPKGETMVVYDLEAKGWRSFRLDRLIEYTLN
jgi:hypothetical protein